MTKSPPMSTMSESESMFLESSRFWVMSVRGVDVGVLLHTVTHGSGTFPLVALPSPETLNFSTWLEDEERHRAWRGTL